MKMTFRWYGKEDSIPLAYIHQIQGMEGIVTALHGVPVGEVWPQEELDSLRDQANQAGLSFEVVESIPVHEDIKLGRPTRDQYIEVFKENLIRCAKVGVKCVCYNFMPVFDWLRTDLHFVHADGASSLAYQQQTLQMLDPRKLSLPGWDESYTPEELGRLLDAYEGVTHEMLFDHLVYFLNAVLPVCDKIGINLAIHPDDPPWDLLGLPRIITKEEGYDALFRAVPHPRNGMTFCTGSLGAGRQNDLPKMAAKFAKRIFFAHLRQLKYLNETDFYENGHETAYGNVNVYGIVRALVENGFDGYVRPDHGRDIWGESGKPGYGLYDRALGAAYLCGLFEAVEKDLQR